MLLPLAIAPPWTALLVWILLAVVVLTVAAVLAYGRFRDTPIFTHLEVEKTLTFLDASAEIADLSTNLKSRVNHNEVDEIWFRNIAADGQITNIRIDDRPPDKSLRKAGTLEVCKEFGRHLRKGEIVTTKLSYELHNSFSGAREGMTHVIATQTADLRLNVQFHQGRMPKSARVFVGYASTDDEVLQAPVWRNDQSLRVHITRPKVGAYYTVEWDW
jgi:hypothetical protein